MKKFTGGFTLIEVMIAAAIMSLISAAALGIFISAQRSWASTSLQMAAARDVSMAVSRIIYGMGNRSGLRSARSADVNWNVRSYYDSGDNSYKLHVPGMSDGSWRLVVTNVDNDVTWIDFQSAGSNIVFWPDINDASSRELIGGNISTSNVVLTNETVSGVTRSAGLDIFIRSVRARGSLSRTSEVSSSVSFRNRF